MASARHWQLTPRQSIERECRRRGASAVVAGCCALVLGTADEPSGVDASLVLALGGPAADRVLDEGAGGVSWYWTRVWAVRGLLWAWDAGAAPAVAAALRDERWRVRELACRVVARHALGDQLPVVADLRDDPVARVRIAAERAVVRLTAAHA